MEVRKIAAFSHNNQGGNPAGVVPAPRLENSRRIETALAGEKDIGGKAGRSAISHRRLPPDKRHASLPSSGPALLFSKNGRGERIRTSDLVVPNHALWTKLSYTPRS